MPRIALVHRSLLPGYGDLDQPAQAGSGPPHARSDEARRACLPLRHPRVQPRQLEHVRRDLPGCANRLQREAQSLVRSPQPLARTRVLLATATPLCASHQPGWVAGGPTGTDCLHTGDRLARQVAEIEPYQLSGMNVYDMRIPCEVPGLCYDFSNIAKYLSRPEVLEYLGVDKEHASWSDCNMAVNMMFRGDWMKDYEQQLPDLLADGIRVLIYAGDQDFICNHLGNKAWTLQLDWPGKDAFNGARDRPWRAHTEKGASEHAGDVRSAKGLTFLRVFAAGHMVPMDQPAASLDMLEQFLAGKL